MLDCLHPAPLTHVRACRRWRGFTNERCGSGRLRMVIRALDAVSADALCCHALLPSRVITGHGTRVLADVVWDLERTPEPSAMSRYRRGPLLCRVSGYYVR